jgi:peptide/nickel transport system ATP-binding protein
MNERRAIIEVRDLTMRFERVKGFRRKVIGEVRAVDGVSFTLHEGETLALVGESGSGKTTTGRCLVRAVEPTGGSVMYEEDGTMIDVLSLPRKELNRVRQKIRMVFQDPFSSLNPRMTVEQLVAEPLYINKVVTSRAEARARVTELLNMVNLDPNLMSRYPHTFSGGQRQRIAIARTLALDPRVVISDEAVSALDVSIQAQILNLLKELQRDRNLTYLFIAHDLSVVRYQSDRIAIMYLGRIVEISTRDEIFTRPLHPYTELLLASAPVPDPRIKRVHLESIGEIPDPANRHSGCAFNTRCPYAQQVCRDERPELREAKIDGDSHLVACHLWETLTLSQHGFETSERS